MSLLYASLKMAKGYERTAISTRDHPYITSAKGLSGWGQKMAIFADVQYSVFILKYVVDGWVRKSPKIC